MSSPDISVPAKRYRLELRVGETLYGAATKPVVALDWEFEDWKVGFFDRPYVGQKLIAFLQEPQPDASYDYDVYHAVQIGRFRVDVETVRNVGRIFAEPEIDKQARAVIAGCSSRNPKFREWCLRTITGKTHNASAAAVRWNLVPGYLGREAVCEVVARVCVSEWHDFLTLQMIDEILADNPRYARSERRYEMLWSMVDAVQRLPAGVRSQEMIVSFEYSFLGNYFAKIIPEAFPDRADESVARLMRMAGKGDSSEHLQSCALGSLCIPMADASEAGRADALTFLESCLADPVRGETAAGCLYGFARIETGRSRALSDQLLAVLRTASQYPEPVRLQLENAARDFVKP